MAIVNQSPFYYQPNQNPDNGNIFVVVGVLIVVTTVLNADFGGNSMPVPQYTGSRVEWPLPDSLPCVKQITRNLLTFLLNIFLLVIASSLRN